MPAAPFPLTLAHSADADDVFMWWPITGKIDPAPPHAVLTPPVLDTGPFAFRALPEDIQRLNRRAIERGDLDITAVSIHTYPSIRSHYALTSCGWSLGEGFGPKLVVRADSDLTPEAIAAQQLRVAVPGLNTTAFLTLSLLLGPGRFTPVPMPFDTIVPTVARGTAPGADGAPQPIYAGLLIHESQLDHPRHGLKTIADLGQWWGGHTGGLPLPLGGNVVRRDLDARFGPRSLTRVAGLLEQSIRHALAHRAESLAYARTFSRDLSDEQLDRYITMYVSPLTLDAHPRGLAAAQRLLSEGFRVGLGPDPGQIDLVRGSATL